MANLTKTYAADHWTHSHFDLSLFAVACVPMWTSTVLAPLKSWKTRCSSAPSPPEPRIAVTVVIRQMRPADRPQAEALWKGLSPYRPGDEPEVEAMYDRALRARDAGDSRWKSLEAIESDDLPPSCPENWVAVVPSGSGEDRVVGTVQVVSPTALSEMPTDHPLSRELRLRDDVAELRLMRVAEDMWRQGMGTRLTEVAIDWSRHHGIRTLVLNTTTPQKPAIGLYHKLGFDEVARTFIDRYELVWLGVDL